MGKHMDTGSELNPEKKNLIENTLDSWSTLTTNTQTSSMLRTGSGRMWTLLLLSSSLSSAFAGGADHSAISPKLKRLREASEPYSWAHLAKGTNKQPGMVDVGRMPGTNWYFFVTISCKFDQ